MNKEFEFYFDYGSPYSYLANTQIKTIAKKHLTKINYKPVLLGAIFKVTGNQSPIQNPVQAKVQYGLKDIQHWVNFYGCQLNFNPHFPVNTLKLMRIACYLKNSHHESFIAFHDAAFHAMWIDEKDLSNDQEILQLLDKVSIDASYLELANQTGTKELLKTQTQNCIDKGVFGLPAFFVGNDMFFGNDRLPLLEHFLSKQEL
jgi:2-hydroxychromene-2-carboxylate isomerase